MKLFEITDEIRKLAEIDDPELLKAKTEQLSFIFSNRALQIGKLCKEQEADINELDIEIVRLTSRKKSLLGKVALWKDYLKTNMEANQMPKIEDTSITLAIRKCLVSCDVEDPMSLPEEYRRVVWQAKKAEIIDHFKRTGEIISGAVINTGNKRLEIK